MYKRNITTWNKHIDFMILDMLVMSISYALADWIRHGNLSNFQNDYYRYAIVIMLLSSVVVSFVRESYKNVLKRGYWIEFKETFFHVSTVFAMLVCLFFVRKNSAQISRTVVILHYIFCLIGSYVLRIVWKKYIIRTLATRNHGRRVLVVTSSKIAEDTIHKLEKNGVDFRIEGVVLANGVGSLSEICGYPIVCPIEDVTSYLVEHVVDEIFFCVEREIVLPPDLIRNCQDMGITIHLNLIQSTGQTGMSFVESFGGYSVLTFSLKSASPRQLFFKRCMDIAGGLVGCFLTGLLCIYVVPKIKKADPGPAFFSQTRIGKNGREFKIHKFRSMYQDAEARKQELLDKNEMDGIMFKMVDDPRILPGIGRFIRETSIDEFPQFWNVLKGDMSLVGTRPPLPSEVSQYDLNHLKRLAVKPGITGLWQISGRNDITDFEEIVRLDSKYIREWNMGMDIKVILKTILVVLKHEGAR